MCHAVNLQTFCMNLIVMSQSVLLRRSYGCFLSVLQTKANSLQKKKDSFGESLAPRKAGSMESKRLPKQSHLYDHLGVGERGCLYFQLKTKMFSWERHFVVYPGNH